MLTLRIKMTRIKHKVSFSQPPNTQKQVCLQTAKVFHLKQKLKRRKKTENQHNLANQLQNHMQQVTGSLMDTSHLQG